MNTQTKPLPSLNNIRISTRASICTKDAFVFKHNSIDKLKDTHLKHPNRKLLLNNKLSNLVKNPNQTMQNPVISPKLIRLRKASPRSFEHSTLLLNSTRVLSKEKHNKLPVKGTPKVIICREVNNTEASVDSKGLSTECELDISRLECKTASKPCRISIFSKLARIA